MSTDDDMKVIKRNGDYEDISFDKILNRVKNLSINIKPQLKLNYSQLVMDVIDQIYPNIPTTVLDELTAQQCASLCTKHCDYGILVELLYQIAIRIQAKSFQMLLINYIILKIFMV